MGDGASHIPERESGKTDRIVRRPRRRALTCVGLGPVELRPPPRRWRPPSASAPRPAPWLGPQFFAAASALLGERDLCVLAAAITIAILLWRKPRHYALWIAGGRCWRAYFDPHE